MPADHDRENRMRELLAEHSSRTPDHGDGLDADTIIARARRRRFPRQLAVGAAALSVIGLLAVAVPVITGPGSLNPALMDASTLSDVGTYERESEEHANGPEPVPVTGDLACESPVESRDINGLDVILEARSATGPAGEWRIDAEIVLTNTSAAPTTVDLTAAIFTLVQDGSTVGAHYGGVDGSPTTLAPGDSSTSTANFEPLPCGLAGALSGEFELWVVIAVDGETAMRSVTISSPHG